MRKPSEFEADVLWAGSGLERLLIDVHIRCRFAGIECIGDWIPEQAAILTYCQLLEKPELGEAIFGISKAHLNAHRRSICQGSIVGATVIAAPSSANNTEDMSDLER